MTAVIFEPVTIPRDNIPPDAVSDTVEYPCEVCGREAGPYGGRGRKPRFCDEHKPSRKTGTGQRRKASSSLAEAAADKLQYLNSLASFAALIFGFPKTASAFAESEETFRVYALEALATDDKLCRSIIRTGNMSAGIGLAIAYGTLASRVVPTAVMEWKERHPPEETETVIDGSVV